MNISVVQYFVQIYIEDTKNEPELRKYATEIHRWLQKEGTNIECVFDQFTDYGVFLLNTMEKYWRHLHPSFDLKFRMDAEDTLSSLRLQRKKYEDMEIIMRQMAMTCIFDSGYRGYD